MAQGTRLQAIEEEATAPASEPRAQAALTGLLMTSLRALSQRAIVALASLVDMALLASAFVLCLMVISAPTPLQLVEVGGYGVFVLVSLTIRRR